MQHATQPQMSEFRIPPISTLAGAGLVSFFSVLRRGRVAPHAYLKVLLTTLVVLVRLPFSLWEQLVFAGRLRTFRFKEPPVFILGHWRSGTTLLHNLLSKDPTSGYITTYGSLFPNNLGSAAVFKTFMRLNMPDRRPADRVELNVDLPQEDEFAFGNLQPNSYYNVFYFPSRYREHYQRAVHHEGLSARERERWYRAYDTLLRKAALVSGRERLLVKNPVNTARIAHLLKLYPDARFIHIHRDPYAVVHSTRRFFEAVIPTLCLEELPGEDFLDDLILDVYDRMHRDYQAQKHLIPAGQLLEMDYAELMRDPMGSMHRIYAQLLKRDLHEAAPPMQAYLSTQKTHAVHARPMSEALRRKVQERLGAYLHPLDATPGSAPVMMDPATLHTTP